MPGGPLDAGTTQQRQNRVTRAVLPHLGNVKSVSRLYIPATHFFEHALRLRSSESRRPGLSLDRTRRTLKRGNP
jgi:hypothetical protein